MKKSTVALWVFCLASIVGDVVTTSVGISMSHVAEGNPLMANFIHSHGFLALFALKVFLLVSMSLVFRWRSIDHRIVPLSLGIVWTVATINNLYVII